MQTSPLSRAEETWISTQIAISVELARAFTGDSEEVPALARLDATWIGWHNDTSANRIDPNTVINALGIAFGKHLAESLGLDWMIVTDQYGTDLAVFGQPNDVTFFPANMIAKRLEEKGPIFTQLHNAAVGSVKELRARKAN